MEVSQDQLNGLVEKYATNACTKVELEELLMIIENEQNNSEVEKAFRSYWEKVIEFDNSTIRQFDNERWNRMFVEMMEDSKEEFGNSAIRRIGDQGQFDNEENYSDNASRVRILRRGKVIIWRKFAVAAVVIGFLGLGIWFVSNQQSTSGDQPVAIKNDVQAPDKTRATIRLADGSVVMLDEVGSGELALQGNVKVVKDESGAISYQVAAAGTEPGALQYNTLFNPRGSKVIDIKLADGSRIWLNAGSSVTYPVAFIGDERKVEITGEAYFEVASAAAHSSSPEGVEKLRRKLPFLVKSGGVVTEVLGTHFNVNSYGDDGMIKVTLLEGSVKVSRDPDSYRESNVKLVPGQSAFVATTANEAIQLHSNVDIEEVMAWKNGMFSFNRTDVRMIMKQLERWYDVEVVYEGSVDNIDFTGGIARKENVSQVLKMLETTGVVDFKIDGKRIVVRRK